MGGVCSCPQGREEGLGQACLSAHRILPPGTFQIKKECLACRGAAAVFDMSYFGKFYLVGQDARKAADWLFSADVSRPPGMEPGMGLFAHFSPRAQRWAPRRVAS